MGRILAIDYGKKRTGIAVTDTLQIIANGLATIPPHELEKFLADYTQKEDVELFVDGLPTQTNGQPSENQARVKQFVEKLKNKIPNIPTIFHDERFTSVLAHQAIIESGIKKKKRQDKGLVDEISATIILQSYMEQKRLGF